MELLMENTAKILEGFAALLWPLIIIILILRFSKSVDSLLKSAGLRKFKLKVGGNELTMEEVSEQQRMLIKDLQEQVINIQRAEVKTNQYREVDYDSKLAGKRILWVDDKPKSNTHLIAHMSESNMEVKLATSNEQGLNLLRSNQVIDAIITPIDRFTGEQYDATAGIAFSKEVRKFDNKVPIYVLCNARTQKKYKKESEDAGITAMTSSPIKLLNMLIGETP